MGPHGFTGGIRKERRLKLAGDLNLVEHPIAQHALSALRNPNTPPERFRMFCNQLLVLLSFEATRTLPLRSNLAATEPVNGDSLAKPVVFLSLARHALGLAHEIVEYIPDVSIGAIILGHRNNNQISLRLHLTQAPALDEARVILFTPVIEDGRTTMHALKLLQRSGATDISLLSFLISGQSLKCVRENVPEATIWTAAVDHDFDLRKGVGSGIGDFAERLYRPDKKS
jgi:uracil phosphoribosyltransferase